MQFSDIKHHNTQLTKLSAKLQYCDKLDKYCTHTHAEINTDICTTHIHVYIQVHAHHN